MLAISWAQNSESIQKKKKIEWWGPQSNYEKMQNSTLRIADRTQDGIKISAQEYGLWFPHRQYGSNYVK